MSIHIFNSFLHQLQLCCEDVRCYFPCMFSGKVLCLKSGADLLGSIPRVLFIHDIAEGRKLIVTLQSIHVIIQRNQAGIVLSKHFYIGADLKIIPSEAGHIFDDFRVDLNHFLCLPTPSKLPHPSAQRRPPGDLPSSRIDRG